MQVLFSLSTTPPSRLTRVLSSCWSPMSLHCTTAPRSLASCAAPCCKPSQPVLGSLKRRRCISAGCWDRCQAVLVRFHGSSCRQCPMVSAMISYNVCYTEAVIFSTGQGCSLPCPIPSSFCRVSLCLSDGMSQSASARHSTFPSKPDAAPLSILRHFFLAICRDVPLLHWVDVSDCSAGWSVRHLQ